MESELVKSLEQLELKKKEIKDLSKESHAITELNNRISSLSSQIYRLSIDVKDHKDFIHKTCDNLGKTFYIIEQSSQMLDIVNALIKMNKICPRLDRYLESVTRNSKNYLKLENDLEGSRLIEAFEQTYLPFQDTLSRRLDLPYHSYAKRIRELRASGYTNS